MSVSPWQGASSYPGIFELCRGSKGCELSSDADEPQFFEPKVDLVHVEIFAPHAPKMEQHQAINEWF